MKYSPSRRVFYPRGSVVLDDVNNDIIDISPEDAAKIQAELEQERMDARPYHLKRAAEYPPVTDYLDAVVKEDESAKQAYIEKCRAIKEKYPKC